MSDEEFDSYVRILEKTITQFNGICCGWRLSKCYSNEEIEDMIKRHPNWVKVI